MTTFSEFVPNIINVYVVSQNTARDNQFKLFDLIPRVIFEWLTVPSKHF